MVQKETLLKVNRELKLITKWNWSHRPRLVCCRETETYSHPSKGNHWLCFWSQVMVMRNGMTGVNVGLVKVTKYGGKMKKSRWILLQRKAEIWSNCLSFILNRGQQSRSVQREHRDRNTETGIRKQLVETYSLGVMTAEESQPRDNAMIKFSLEVLSVLIFFDPGHSQWASPPNSPLAQPNLRELVIPLEHQTEHLRHVLRSLRAFKTHYIY